MTECYKYTDDDLRTYGRFQWTVGEWVQADGEGHLCTEHWLHGFDDPLVAEWVCRALVSYNPTRLFRCECGGQCKRDGTLKVGYTRMRLVEELERPTITTAQRVRAAIYAAQEVLPCGSIPQWDSWAEDWLNGRDRSKAAAHAAYAAGYADDGRLNFPAIIRRAIHDEDHR